MRNGRQLDERTFASNGAFPWIGAASGALIAGGLGYIAVPNSMVPHDTFQAHASFAAALLLAAAPWAYRLARGASRRPLKAAFGLFVGTYLLSFVTLAVCQAPVERIAILGNRMNPLDELGFWGSLVPWIAAGALFWSGTMLLLGPLPETGPVRSGLRGHRQDWLSLAIAVAVVAVTVVAIEGPDLRRIGWTLPDPPRAIRPTVVGVIADLRDLGGSCRVTLSDGRIFDLADVSCSAATRPAVGDLFLGSDSDGSWHEFLEPSAGNAPGGSACWGGVTVPLAWDRGDSVLFDDGLELPKAPGFTSEVSPRPFFSDQVYDVSIPCVNKAGQILFMQAFGYS